MIKLFFLIVLFSSVLFSQLLDTTKTKAGIDTVIILSRDIANQYLFEKKRADSLQLFITNYKNDVLAFLFPLNIKIYAVIDSLNAVIDSLLANKNKIKSEKKWMK